jgi:glycosyltransferase involved in cell wall biosynthesis
MRIARVITRLNIGGPSVQALDLCRELASRGIETCLIHGRLANGEGDITDWEPIAAARATYVEHLVRPVSPLSDLKALWTIYKTLLEWRPHVIHTHMAKAGALGRLAGLVYNLTPGVKPRARLVHTYHGHVFDGYFTSSTTRVFVAIERWLAKRTDLLIAISPRVLGDLRDTYAIARPPQLKLVPLGFNFDRLASLSDEDRASARARLQIPEDAFVVGTVGRLTAIKNQALFLETARRLSEKCKRYVFLIAGDGELRGALEAQAGFAGLNGNARFLGWRRDLNVVYAAMDAFMLTSLNEGTPVSLIEAMASGVAVVATDVGGVRDVISSPDDGVLVPADDPAALVAAVKALAADPARRRAVAARGRETVLHRFDGARLVDEIANAYSGVLASS